MDMDVLKIEINSNFIELIKNSLHIPNKITNKVNFIYKHIFVLNKKKILFILFMIETQNLHSTTT